MAAATAGRRPEYPAVSIAAAAMHLHMGRSAAEHIYLLVDGKREPAAEKRLYEDTARDTTIGPLVEPATIVSSLPASCGTPDLLPPLAVGRARHDLILIAAMACLDDGRYRGRNEAREGLPCHSVGTVQRAPSRSAAMRLAASLSMSSRCAGDRSVSLRSCTSSVKRVGSTRSGRSLTFPP